MTTRRSFTRRTLGLGASALGLTLAAPGILRAQAYPSRPVRMLVGFAPGGPTDIVARQLAQYMTEPLGQSIVIENRGGANGNIAAQEIASAAPTVTTSSTTPRPSPSARRSIRASAMT